MDVEQVFKEGSAAFDVDDFASAKAKLVPLAEAGHSGAQYLVAQMYRWGDGVDQNAELSVTFYKAAADQGHPQAAFYYSMLRLPGGTSAPAAMEACPKDQAESERYLAIAVVRSKESAEAGDMDSMAFLGFLFHSGMGVPLDGAEAIRWYTKAFEAGGHGAANSLSLVYYEGDIRVRDRAKAFYWYAKAKELECQFVGISEFEAMIQCSTSDRPQGPGSAVWGYEFHIRRPDRPISLEEWQSAVDSTEGVRLQTGSSSIANPTTGEIIDIPVSAGEAEVFIGEHGKWLPMFRWRPRRGDITFALTRELFDEKGPARSVIRQIATHLDAKVIGDGGEDCEWA